MPDDRLARTRGTLPPGFQFGDGGIPIAETLPVARPPGWRRPHETAAEQLARRGAYNVIEGDHDLS